MKRPNCRIVHLFKQVITSLYYPTNHADARERFAHTTLAPQEIAQLQVYVEGEDPKGTGWVTKLQRVGV